MTFPANELLYGEHKKEALISKVIFRKIYILNQNICISFTYFKYSLLPGKHIYHYECIFVILIVSFFIGNVFFEIGLKYQKLCTFKHHVLFYPIFVFSEQRDNLKLGLHIHNFTE